MHWVFQPALVQDAIGGGAKQAACQLWKVACAFSNALVSSADARGVMQIIPDTWNFIEGQLAA